MISGDRKEVTDLPRGARNRTMQNRLLPRCLKEDADLGLLATAHVQAKIKFVNSLAQTFEQNRGFEQHDTHAPTVWDA
eukprot:scaffold53883_cov17-Tisochrysis_lutea.AAC.1